MINEALGANRVIATVTVEDAGLAASTAAALVKGGVNVVEVLLRTPSGLDAIRAIGAEVPEAIVGAGTVLDTETLEQAADAGATFVVSPGFDSYIADAAESMRMPYLPGAVTATEMQTCLRRGITTLKFFPASTLGGPAAIRAFSAAFSAAGVKFIPTGGVDQNTAFDYLDLPTVRAVGMSWLASSSLIEEGAFSTVTKRAQAVIEGLKRANQ